MEKLANDGTSNAQDFQKLRHDIGSDSEPPSSASYSSIHPTMNFFRDAVCLLLGKEEETDDHFNRDGKRLA